MSGPVDRNYHLLVADADPATCSAVHRVLGEHGHHVTVTHGGDEAWQELRRTEYDLLILNLDLAELDGFEIMARSRHNAELADLPMIVLSNSNDDDICERALALGAAAYLTKPLKLPLLTHCVWEILRNRARDQELRWLKARLGIETDREVEPLIQNGG